jgi:hypothetical protein
VDVAEGDVDDLRLGVEVDGVRASFAADAGGLDPAEGGAQVSYVVGVEPDHAGLDGMGDAVAALEIRGPDVGGETVLGGVGQLDRLDSSSKGATATTGPKISFWKMRASRETSAKTVG